MKVLYVGHYRDGTGWGQAAIDYILSLDTVGVDVVPRPIRLNKNEVNLPARILELEGKSESGADIVVQHTLPHYMWYDGHYRKNVGLFATEAVNCLQSMSWDTALQQMDVRITPNPITDIETHVVPHACDITKFQQGYNEFKLDLQYDTFVFYFVGELTKRKNVEALLRAYHSEFTTHDNVALVIKGSPPGMSPQESRHWLSNLCDTVKDGLKKYRPFDMHLPEYLITGRLSHEELMGLHQACDCFVMPSWGEACCLPMLDAMGFGNSPVVTNHTGMSYYTDDEAGYLVDARLEPCFGADSFPELYTCEHQWWSVDINDLQRKMRQAYDDRRIKAESSIKRAYEFSYEKVGTMFMEVLSD